MIRKWTPQALSAILRRMTLQDALVWVDLEMTGLSMEKDKIIEVAVVLTDGQLKQIIPGPNLVIQQPKHLLDGMDAWCTKQHGKSGLTAAVLASTTSTKQAETAILDFVKQHVPEPRTAVLAGNSVHVDRMFLLQEMPCLLDHLHYRIVGIISISFSIYYIWNMVDVSSIKELAKRWYPDIANNLPPKPTSHRYVFSYRFIHFSSALDDILSSIEELKYYRKTMFKQPNE